MTTVLIADDHPIVRLGLRQILERHGEISIAGEVESGEVLLSAVHDVGPDVLIMDIGMPGPSFSGLIRTLRAEAPATPVLVLSVYPEEQYALEALRAGAAGYLSKNQSPDHLVEAIRTVARGGQYLTPAVYEIMLRNADTGDAPPPHEALTPREYEVMLLLGEGLTTKQCAVRLEVSPKTIASHRASLLHKLGLRSAAEVVRYCIRNHLLP